MTNAVVHGVAMVCVFATLCFDNAEAAQPYPAKPIRVVVPFTPGGGSDLMGRLVAQKLTESYKQPAIVDNRPGAGGRVGTESVARAAPDGYTLLLTGSGSSVLAPALYQKLAYDVQKDFAPVTLVAAAACMLSVHPTMPVRSVKQLIAMAKAKPGALNYSSAGIGTPGHLAGELFQSIAQVKMSHVAFKGTAPAVMSVMTGEVEVIFANMVSIVAPVHSGRVRAIAVTSLQRSSLFPEVPTFAESGLPGYEMVTLYGVYAPAGTPAEIVPALNAVLVKGLQNEDTRKRLLADGSELRTSTPEEFTRIIRSETAKWTKVIRAAGIKPE